LVAQTGDRLGRVEPGGEDDRAHRRGHAGEDVDHGLVEVGPDAGQADRLLVATDRVGIPAEPRLAQDHRGQDDGPEEDHAGEGDAVEVDAVDVAKVGVDYAEGIGMAWDQCETKQYATCTVSI